MGESYQGIASAETKRALEGGNGHNRLTFERRRFVVVVILLLAVVGDRRVVGRCIPGWRYWSSRSSSTRSGAQEVVHHVGKELCRDGGAATSPGLLACRSVRVRSAAAATTATTGTPGIAGTPSVVLGRGPEAILSADEVDLLDDGENNLGREVVDRDSATSNLGTASL